VLIGMQNSAKRGSVLVLVLWTLLFLGTLGLAVGARVSAALNAAVTFKASTEAYYAAKSGVALAIAELHRDEEAGRRETNTWDTLAEAWSSSEDLFRDVRVGTGYFSIQHVEEDESGGLHLVYGLEDEERRINLNLASTNLLAALFVRVGNLAQQQADTLAASLGEYRQRKAKVGSSPLTPTPTEEYAGGVTDLVNRLESVYELRFLEGVTPELFSKLEPYITVYGSGAVNLNTASKQVLVCLAEAFGEEEAERWAANVIAARPLGRGGVAELLSRYRRIGNRAVTFCSTCFRGIATGRAAAEAGNRCKIVFVYDRDAGRIVSWIEY